MLKTTKYGVQNMNVATLMDLYEKRKKMWDDFEKKYAAKQLYETRDYGIDEIVTLWPRICQLLSVQTKELQSQTNQLLTITLSCGTPLFCFYLQGSDSKLDTGDLSCKQKNGDDEAMLNSSSVQNQDEVCTKDNKQYGAKVDSNVQREESEQECISPKSFKLSKRRAKCNKTTLKCHKEINKIPVKRVSRAKLRCTETLVPKHKTPTEVHSTSAIDAPITAEGESGKIAVKILHKSERIKSKLQDKNQHQMHTDITEGDLKLPSGNITPAFSAAVKTSEQASDRDCSKIKCRENVNDIAGLVMENATKFEGVEVRQRCTKSRSKLGKKDSALTSYVNLKDACTHFVCENFPLDELQRRPFTEPIKVKDNPYTARELCNSSVIPGNEEHDVIKENSSDKSLVHRSKNIDSSALTSISTVPNSSENAISDKIQILKKQTKKKRNKTPQTNKIANISTISTIRLNNSVQTEKNNIKASVCASSSKNASSEIMHAHQRSSSLSSVDENDNDLHVTHKNYVSQGKMSHKSVLHRPKNTGASDLTSTSATLNSSLSAVSNMIQIHKKQTKREKNKISQTRRTEIVSSISTAALNDAVQTGKSNANAVVCPSVPKTVSNNIMDIHQASSKESSLLESNNDLHVTHKSSPNVLQRNKKKANATNIKHKTHVTHKSSLNLLQRNKKKANATNIKDKTVTKHKASSVLLHGDTVPSSKDFCSKNNHKSYEKGNISFNDKFIQKSSIDGNKKLHLQDKMDQSTEASNENSLPVTATEKRCGSKSPAKQKLEGECTSYITVNCATNTINVPENLSIRRKNKSRKRLTSDKTEQQILTCSFSEIRKSTATEGQDALGKRNVKLDEINIGEFRTKLNSQAPPAVTKFVAAGDTAVKSKQLQRKTENIKKSGENESNSMDAENITALGCRSYNSDHSFEGKQRGESERSGEQRKIPVKLITQPCSFKPDEHKELPHSIKTANKKQSAAANILDFNSEDKHQTKTIRELKSAVSSDDIVKQLCENAKCIRNRSPEKQVKENLSNNSDQHNNNYTMQVPLTDSLLKIKNSTIKCKDKKLDICRSKGDFCEKNETNSCKHNLSNSTDAESTQSKYQHIEIQKQKEHKDMKSDTGTGLVSKNDSNSSEVQSLQSKTSTYESLNVQNKSLQKLPSNPLFQAPCSSKSIEKNTSNTNELHNVAPITLKNSDKNLVNELCDEDIYKNKSAGQEIRKNLRSELDKQNKGNKNKELLKPLASKMSFLTNGQQKFTTKELEHVDILKEMHRYKISGNSCNAEDTLSRNKYEQTQDEVKTKRRKLNNTAHARDGKVSARVDLVLLESSVCSDVDCNDIWQLQNKCAASGRIHAQSQALNKPLSQLSPCTSDAKVGCQSNFLSSNCIASKMLTKCNSESWTTFTSTLVNDLQTPVPKVKKLRLLYRK